MKFWRTLLAVNKNWHSASISHKHFIRRVSTCKLTAGFEASINWRKWQTLSLFIWTSLVPVLLREKYGSGEGSIIIIFWLVYFGTPNRETDPDLIFIKWFDFIFVHMYHMSQKPHLVPLSSTWWLTSHTRCLCHPHDGPQTTFWSFAIHMMAHKPHSGPLSSTWWPISHSLCHNCRLPNGSSVIFGATGACFNKYQRCVGSINDESVTLKLHSLFEIRWI